MKNIILPAILLAALLVGCTNDPTDNQSNTTATQADAIDPATIKFVCESADEPTAVADAPRHEVYLQIGHSKVKVADILNCEILNKDVYKQNQVPDKAIAAVGGWWAGGGDYLYIIEEGGNYVVKKGAIFEESEDNDFGYKTIMTFSKTGEEVY